MTRFGRMMRQARRAARRDPVVHALMPLDDTVAAVGSRCLTRAGFDEVDIDHIVGSAARHGDFDRRFRPLARHLRPRWERVAAAAPSQLPPVQLVRLGEMYFVKDGHHRVSVARANGLAAVDAHVTTMCTEAYTCHCLTALNLPAKAAERHFLQRFPLADELRRTLWLDTPQDWGRLERAANRWVVASTGPPGPADTEHWTRRRLRRWWDDEVTPAALGCRGADRVELSDYLCTLRS